MQRCVLALVCLLAGACQRGVAPPPTPPLATPSSQTPSVAPMSSATVQATIPLDAVVDPYFGVSASAVGGGSIWLLSAPQRELIRVDIGSEQIVARLHVADPASLAYGQGSAWVTTRAGELLRVDPSDDSVVARIRVARGLTNLTVGAGGVWVADRHGGIFAIDPRSHAVALFSQVGDPETDDFTMAATDGALLAGGVNSGLSRVDVERGRVRHFSYATGDRDELAAGLGAIWAASQSTGQVYKLDPTSGRILRTWQLAPEAPPTAPGLGQITTGDDAAWAVWTSWQKVQAALLHSL